MAKTKTNGEKAGPGIGHNGENLSEKGGEFVKRVETLNGDLASLKGSYMADCKTVREDIKEVLTEAADAGITRATIRTTVKLRAMARKEAELRDGLKENERDTLDAIRLKLGDLVDLPLGAAALQAAQPAAT